MMKQPMAGKWGPDGKSSALSITFDNFGEAAEIEMGWWGDQPVGDHFTAHFLPQLIETLDGEHATYFVEASNAEIYPDALRLWADAGNEIGIHAWRHEVWDQCSPEKRRELLARSTAAFHAIGIEPIGFRPPGGGLSDEGMRELRDAGLLYASGLSAPGAVVEGDMVSLPFRWSDVDAYMLEDIMGFARVRDGLDEKPASIDAWRENLFSSLREAREANGHRVIIFHPHFVAPSAEKLAIVHDLIIEARAHDMWIAPAGEVARFVAREVGLVTDTVS